MSILRHLPCPISNFVFMSLISCMNFRKLYALYVLFPVLPSPLSLNPPQNSPPPPTHTQLPTNPRAPYRQITLAGCWVKKACGYSGRVTTRPEESVHGYILFIGRRYAPTLSEQLTTARNYSDLLGTSRQKAWAMWFDSDIGPSKVAMVCRLGLKIFGPSQLPIKDVRSDSLSY